MTQGKMTGRRGPVPVRCGTTAVGRAEARPKGDRTRATRSKQGVGLESPNPEKHRKSDETTDTSDVEGACFQGWGTDAIHLSSTRTCPGNDQSIQLATNRRGTRTISAQKQPPVPGETSTERAAPTFSVLVIRRGKIERGRTRCSRTSHPFQYPTRTGKDNRPAIWSTR